MNEEVQLPMELSEDENETNAVIAWLQECYNCMEEERIVPQNSSYTSTRGVLTDEYVDRMIDLIDGEFIEEMTRYPDFHYNNADGATTTPDFHRLDGACRRALVEGLDRVMGFESPS